MGGAAAVAGVMGLFALGPFSAVAAAGAAAYACTRKDAVGDMARKVGKTTSSGVKKVSKFNEKHDVTGKVTTGVLTAGAKAAEVTQKVGESDAFASFKTGAGNVASGVSSAYNSMAGKSAGGSRAAGGSQYNANYAGTAGMHGQRQF